jgi:uncharacterized protein (DUF2164 family)
MALISLDNSIRSSLGRLLQARLKAVMGVDADPVDCLELLDALTESLGPHFYNQGLYDAQAAVQARVEAIIEDIGGLEKAAKLY